MDQHLRSQATGNIFALDLLYLGYRLVMTHSAFDQPQGVLVKIRALYKPHRRLAVVSNICLTVMMLVYAGPGLAADETIYPLITYKCDPNADIITITNSLLPPDKGVGYPYSDEDGTYSPWNMVEIEETSANTRIVRTNRIVKTCPLSSGDYTVTLEPQIFSRNLRGTCGKSISSAFTISYDGFDLKERTPFEDFCRGNSPIITRVTVFGKTGEVKIKRIPRYKFY